MFEKLYCILQLAVFNTMFCENVSDILANLFPATMHTADRLSLTVMAPMKRFPVITLNLFQTVVCYH